MSVSPFQVPPTPGTAAWPPSFPSVPTSRATRVTSTGERVQLIDHGVDGVLEREDLALHVHGDLLRQIALRDRGRHVGDVANLAGQVRGHQVHVVGQILPCAGDAAHLRLAAELAFGADLARHASHFGRERVELVHHRVDGVLQLEDLALYVDRDLLRQVAERDRGRHLGDVADLAGQVRGHGVHVVGKVLPRAADARHLRLSAELAFGADLAGHARHFASEGIKLIDHHVDGVLELENFALHVDGDLLGEVALGDRGRHLGDVADLAGQVTGHQVHAVGKVGPGAANAFHLRLAAELAFRTHFAGNASHFGRERVELVHHDVDGVLEFEDFALHVDGDLLGKVAARHGGRHFGDVADLTGEVGRHRVHVVGQVGPGAGDAFHLRLAAELALRAHFAGNARHFATRTNSAGPPSC